MRQKKIIFIIAPILLLSIAMCVGFSKPGNKTKHPRSAKKFSARPSVKAIHGMTRGSASAPVKIEEYSTFQCGACRNAPAVIDEIFEKYKGQVFLSFNVFPFKNNLASIVSAKAAECARQQNKFWEYHDLLFNNQFDWARSPVPLNLNDKNNRFARYAVELGLNTKKFNQCLTSSGTNKVIQSWHAAAVARGVHSTPTFYINGELVVGPKSLEAKYEKIINKILEKK